MICLVKAPVSCDTAPLSDAITDGAGKTPFSESRQDSRRSPAPAANGNGPPQRYSAPPPGARPTSAGAAPGAPSPLTQKPRRRPPPAPPGQ